MSDGENFKVGYCRPPPEHRFKKGVSGNPSGRKRKGSTEAEVLARIRDERIPMMWNGRKVMVSPFEAAVRKALQTALTKGNVRDLMILMNMLKTHGAESVDDRAAQARRDGEAVIEKLFEHLERTVTDDAKPEPPD